MKVPRGIQGEKSSKDMASSRNLVSTIGAQESPKKGEGWNQVSGRVSIPCWHATPVANAPWKQLAFGEGHDRYQGHKIGGKSDRLGIHCCSRVRMSFKVIRHVFGFEIEFLENKDIGIFGHFIVIDFIKQYSNHTIFHLFQLPDFVDLELCVLSVMANDAYL